MYLDLAVGRVSPDLKLEAMCTKLVDLLRFRESQLFLHVVPTVIEIKEQIMRGA